MTSHGYNYDDDIDIVDNGWNAHEAHAMRRSTPQSHTIHMTQQMTTKVAPAYDAPTSEPIRVRRKQRQISVHSTDALPKAKAEVIIKKPKVQLPGHV